MSHSRRDTERDLLPRRASVVLSLFAPALVQTVASNALAQTAGNETSLEYTAPWPPWVTILIVVLAALFTFGLYFREQSSARNWIKFGLATLRFALMCIVLWMMYGYTARPFRTDLPDLLFFVDNSASMATEDPETKELDTSVLDKTRLGLAKNVLLRDKAKLLAFAEENYQPKVVALEASKSEASATSTLVQQVDQLTATAKTSRLGARLREALQQQRGRPVAAVVYLSDGITTDGPPLSQIGLEAKQRGMPLHVVGLGSEIPQRDLQLSDLLVDDVVFIGDLVTFDLSLAGTGFKDETIKVTVRSADGTFEPKTQEVTFSSDSETQPVRITMKAEQVGNFEFIVETPAVEGEANSDNNALTTNVEVRDEQTRLLLVQSYPSYEYHYLKTLFERGSTETSREANPDRKSSVELSVVLQEADPEFSDIDARILPNFPERNELFEYDVVIFGDVNPTFLGNEALVNVRDFVRERGRGFVGIAGPRYMPATYTDTPLAEILPFDIRSTLAPPADLPIERGYRPKITPLGRRIPSMQLSLQSKKNEKIWSELPELYWLLEVDSLKPGVRVLAEHPTRTNTSGRPLPITTLSYVGAGKVLFQNTDDSWRWRIGNGDEYFARYWQQTLRYLSRFKLGEGREIELTSDRQTYTRGEIVRLRARFFDERRAPSEKVVVLVEQQGRGQRRVVLQRDDSDRGIFSADVTNLGAGSYHAWISEPTPAGDAPATDFEVTTPNTELSRLEMDAADLKRAAELSGGKYYTFETSKDLIGNLPAGKQVRIEPLPPEPLWNSWKLALLFLVLLVTEWLSRRQVGMV